MLAKSIFLFMTLSVLTACQNKSKEKAPAPNGNEAQKQLMNINELDSSVIISQPSVKQRIVRFDDKFPIRMDIYDSLLHVIMAKSDTSIYIFNTKDATLARKLGCIGHGPQDILSPEHIGNNYEIKKKNGGLLYYDLNARRLFCIDKAFQLKPAQDFVEEMHPTQGLNISGDYWIGQLINIDNKEFFRIHNAQTKKTIKVDRYPVIPDSEKIPSSYLYSVNIGCNQQKQRIIVGMYFMDLIHIYDWAGKRLHTLSLSPDYYPERAVARMLNNGNYIGYTQLYSTEKYCYLRRNLENGVTGETTASQIIRIDWEGAVCTIYNVDEQIGNFCVDDMNKYLYCILHSTDSTTNDEYYDIVSYEL